MIVQSFRFFHLTFLLISIASCVTVPTQEMSDARLAVKAAQDVRAAYYVPNTLAKAEENLAKAEDSLRTGQLIQARRAAILAKEQAVNAHKMAIAIDYAKTIWQAVVAIKFSGQDVNKLIKKAEIAAQQEDIDSALHFADEAQRQGELALNQAYLEQTALLLCNLDQQKDSFTQEELTILNAAQAAYQKNQGEQAHQFAKQLADKFPDSQNACSIKSHKQ